MSRRILGLVSLVVLIIFSLLLNSREPTTVPPNERIGPIAVFIWLLLSTINKLAMVFNLKFEKVIMLALLAWCFMAMLAIVFAAISSSPVSEYSKIETIFGLLLFFGWPVADMASLFPVEE